MGNHGFISIGVKCHIAGEESFQKLQGCVLMQTESSASSALRFQCSEEAGRQRGELIHLENLAEMDFCSRSKSEELREGGLRALPLNPAYAEYRSAGHHFCRRAGHVEFWRERRKDPASISGAAARCE
ncbi:hypothetical protein TWF679_004651 [Orbilia oligospora]|uniref:Uncharacterized protein n=1 Tax=Orbilia oligospora TaxID=2813651 RepID=A0A8H8VDV6_ORBOL|nr:hypothetical protein TWF679_004651 [Orbilia oligospora]